MYHNNVLRKLEARPVYDPQLISGLVQKFYMKDVRIEDGALCTPDRNLDLLLVNDV